MQVLVDDLIAVAADLGVLELPPGIEYPLLTVYSFRVRIANALTVERPTTGMLQRLVEAFGTSDDDVERILEASTSNVHALDPNRHVAAVAHGKRKWGSFVPAEIVAAALHEDVEVRLSPGNARGGQVVDALAESGIRALVWELTQVGESLHVTEIEIASS